MMSTGGKRSYTSSKSYHCIVCSRRFVANSSSVVSTFSEAMTRVTIHTCACALLENSLAVSVYFRI